MSLITHNKQCLVLFILSLGVSAIKLPGADMLQWEEPEGGCVLFSVQHIVRFDWERQVFELKREKAMDLMAYLVPHKHLFRRFSVKDGQGTIYEGRFISPASSFSYGGPTIISWATEVQPPFYAILSGYASARKDDAQRFAPRLRDDLERAGVLKAIAPNEKPVPIARNSTEWEGDKDEIRIRAESFPETFRIGEVARVHVFFATSKSASTTRFEVVQIQSSLVHDSGFFCTTEHAIPEKEGAEVIKSGVHVLWWKPWGPTYGAQEVKAKPGPATLSLSIIIRKTTPRGEATLSSVPLARQAVNLLASEN